MKISQEIIRMNTKELMVSVQMITYKHEEFIKQAIEGVLMQETDFEFDLIIADDCSPDNTNKIVDEIIKNHSKSVRIKYSRHEKNIGMQANGRFAFNQCNGKYIAFCEGDDYWTDPLKLQKQVDFLEANPDYGMVHSSYSVYNESNKTLSSNSKKNVNSGDVFRSLIISGNNVSTLTVLARAELLKNATRIIDAPCLNNNWAMGDYPMWLSIAQQSKISYLKDNTSVYRKLNDSASNSLDGNKELTILKSLSSIGRWFSKEYGFEDCLPVINENDLFIGYHLSLIYNTQEKVDYRKKVRKHKIINRSFRNLILYIVSYSRFLERILCLIESRH